MILTILKCEMCDAQHAIRPVQTPAESIPPEWLTLYRGDHIGQEGWHFCSERCLASWASGTTTKPSSPAEDPAPQSTMRRFWLIDAETVDQIEGVRWTNGCVNIDPKKANNGDAWFYHDWNELKIHYPGSGVQWIDQDAGSKNKTYSKIDTSSSEDNVFTIIKWHRDENEAKRLAENDYDYFFHKQHPELKVIRKDIKVLRELRAPEGLVGYRIRTECEPEVEVSSNANSN